MQVARGNLGIPLPSMPGPKTLYGVGAGTRGFLSSADMDLGVLLESPRGVSPCLELGHARAFSSRAVAAVSCFLRVNQGNSGFPSRLSLEAFPPVFPTRLSQRAVPRDTVV